jgi:hypothetical protein
MKPPEKCLKCGGRMAEGFVLDQSQACRLVSKWVEGKPEVSFFMGARINGREQHEIRSYRCIVCGFLESYAPES